MLSFKNIIFAIPLLINSHASGSRYFFSTIMGDDLRTEKQAQNSTTPWKTLNKLNSWSFHFQPGDSIFFKKGETFYGSIIIKTSGTLMHPIVFSSYGEGNQPIISGLSKVFGWTKLRNGVWESAPCADAGQEVNTLLINASGFAMGRYPNNGFLAYKLHFGNTAIIDNHLSSLINWTGAEVIIRKERWAIDRCPLTKQVLDTIFYTSQTSYLPHDGYGYFIQNDIRTLDQTGEWYYNKATKRIDIYYGQTRPPEVIQISTIDNLISVKGFNDIIFSDLVFKGSNLNSFELANQQRITINHCMIDFSGIDAVYGFNLTELKILHCTINHSNNNAICLAYNCRRALIEEDTIKNTGLKIGMTDAVHYVTCTAINTGGSGPNSCPNAVVTDNIIDSTGYDAIAFRGDSTLIKNNVISNFCLTKDDGGGIYNYKGSTDSYVYSGIRIIGNIIINGKTATDGTLYPLELKTWGIYADDNSEGLAILSNTVANMPSAGIFLHNAHQIIIKNNTLFNNSIQLSLSHDDPYLSRLKDITNINNIFYSKTSMQIGLNFYTVEHTIKSYGYADRNFYESSFKGVTFHTKKASDSRLGVNKNLSEWQAASKSDTHSKISLKSSPTDTTNSIRFFYNPTDHIKNILLNRVYVDAKDSVYKSVMKLNPYSSVILAVK